MSGPIVRKYGFPNFEKIFGAREIQHGVDEPRPEAESDAKPEAGSGQVAETSQAVDEDKPAETSAAPEQ